MTNLFCCAGANVRISIYSTVYYVISHNSYTKLSNTQTSWNNTVVIGSMYVEYFPISATKIHMIIRVMVHTIIYFDILYRSIIYNMYSIWNMPWLAVPALKLVMIYTLALRLLTSLVTLGMLCHALTVSQTVCHRLITTTTVQTSVSKRCPS